MFDKVLIANRGEIAVRIALTCRDLAVTSVAVFSDVDARARHVTVADAAVPLRGTSPAETYLNREAIIEAALATGAQAIHPGYGFMSEKAGFAEAVIAAGLVWIGPPPEAMRLVADKIAARRAAEGAGVPVVPGMIHPLQDSSEVEAFGAEHGYPVAIKAAGGGGGRGLKVARSAAGAPAAFTAARRESETYFGQSAVYVERWLEGPKHMEVQVLAPGPGEAWSLGVRDCSLQRRYQKLVEEAPPPLFAERSAAMGEAAVALSKACGYVGAGTVEFLVDASGRFYFLEVNARLQVEHAVTEAVTGLDLVACQLRIASGERLGFSSDGIEERGHAIECRINAEDPASGFRPAPGRITRYVEPSGPGIRFDSGYGAGDEVPGVYDSLVAKLIAWGADREEARLRMLSALAEVEIEGIQTTVPAHLLLLQTSEFVTGSHTTATVESRFSDDGETQRQETERALAVGGRSARLWHPSMIGSAVASVPTELRDEAVAPMQGTVRILVSEGEEVEAGQAVAVIEAMKMETTVPARRAGTVSSIEVTGGEMVEAGRTLVVLE